MIALTPARFSGEIDLRGSYVGSDNPLEISPAGSFTSAHSGSSPSNGDSLTNRRPNRINVENQYRRAINENQQDWNRELFGRFGGWSNELGTETRNNLRHRRNSDLFGGLVNEQSRETHNNLRHVFSSINLHEGGINDSTQGRSSRIEPTVIENNIQSRNHHSSQREDSYWQA